MTRLVIGALILLTVFTWTVHLMSTPNEPQRYHNGDRSNFGKVRP